jgi:hypothetical protein
MKQCHLEFCRVQPWEPCVGTGKEALKQEPQEKASPKDGSHPALVGVKDSQYCRQKKLCPVCFANNHTPRGVCGSISWGMVAE